MILCIEFVDAEGFSRRFTILGMPSHNFGYGQHHDSWDSALKMKSESGPTSRPALDKLQNCERIQPEMGGAEGRGVLP